MTTERLGLSRLLAANIVLFWSSVVIFALAFHVRGPATLDDREVLRQTSFFYTMSPKFATKEFLTYPIEHNAAVLRQPPSPEVDAYWERISDTGVMPVGAAQIRGLGKDPSTVVKVAPDWNLSLDDAYLMQLDYLHLLHCLSSMRKSLHYNYPHYHPDGHPPAYVAHLSHCQEALAHWLMCRPSVDLIKFDWVENHSRPFPDFDIARKCIDFEALLEWQEEHRLPDKWLLEKWKTMDRPDEVIPRRSPVLNDESKAAQAVSFQDSFKAPGMPVCERWREE
ncbi:hypothetical protein ISF_07990 [Cordyceps fumosorosea ARSEF 2679]|uniref:Tat pathway signal sequence n=1 Tax=Cordyceps fumosorosea (strain ARSEF 2679) TaxID=1081104 RepID=A0A167NES7_CORFA|nr:hypothetical protein ISF_07990 [Cordyceps fumosorosea ARSEF 2679]OAA55479.1 hypothetical protein ISF_07990 [Cordyceps fumosorosea ARSEF 2679]